ncbi:hypothetical protein J3A83DRAFT_4109555 [Scleroderma citrinum]
MSDCGICLEPLKKPVSIPCGHIHCEKCLRSHIINGKDALASTCPTCRQAFHIATPDLAVVPEKYHKFIQPSIRQVYIDVPSISKLTKEVGSLKTQIKELKRKTKDLDTLCETYEHQLAICDQKERDWKLKVENLLFDNGELRQECESLKSSICMSQKFLSSWRPPFIYAVAMARTPHLPQEVAWTWRGRRRLS